MKLVYLHHGGTYQPVSAKAEDRWLVNSRGKRLHTLAMANIVYPGKPTRFKSWEDFATSLAGPDPLPSTSPRDATVLCIPISYFTLPASGSIDANMAAQVSGLDYDSKLDQNGFTKVQREGHVLQSFAFRIILIVMLLMATGLAAIGIGAAVGGA